MKKCMSYGWHLAASNSNSKQNKSDPTYFYAYERSLQVPCSGITAPSSFLFCHHRVTFKSHALNSRLNVYPI